MPGDFVVMQGNLRPSVTRDCLALAKSKGATTALNPSPTYAARDYDWILVDLVLVNRGEAIELAGGGAEEAARTLCKKGAGAVVLTLGAEGAAFFSADDAFRICGAKGDRDRRGRGGRRVLRGVDRRQSSWPRLERRAAAATEAASASVARKGVLASFPSREEMGGILKRAALGRLEEHRQ